MDKQQIQIQELLKQAEADLQHNPKEYQKKLLHYSLLGYGIIILIVLLLALLVGGTVVLAMSSTVVLLLLFKKKLFIPLLIMVWVLFKSVFIRFPKPDGITITAQQAPKLFKLIDETREKLDSAPIHQVLITPEFNAAIIQTPRFIAFGFTHNTLVLGFELLLSMSTEEVKSVIAHELGHLSGNHSKFQGWIYRTRDSFRNMMFNLDQHNGWTTAPVRKFFNWYSPRFSAYSFALARLNEYEADKVAAELTSREVAAQAMLKMYAYSSFIQNGYWDAFNQQIIERPAPEKLPYAALVDFINTQTLPEKEAQAAIDLAKKVVTTYHDTHPCFKDRLEALDSEQLTFRHTQCSAANDLPEETLKSLTNELDQWWSEFALEQWREEFEESKKQKKEVEALRSVEPATLDQENLWKLAWLSEKFECTDEPLALYQTYQQRYPNDVKGWFSLGRLLIANKQDEGLEWLAKAARKDEFTESAGEIAYHYLLEANRPEEATQWLDKIHQLEETCYEAQLERANVMPSDEFISPTVNLEDYQDITRQIIANKKVKSVWLAQKKLKHFTESPLFVYAIEPKRGLYLSDSLAENILEKLNIESDAVVYIVSKSQNKKIFQKVVQAGKAIAMTDD